jgi:hypothetical protein
MQRQKRAETNMIHISRNQIATILQCYHFQRTPFWNNRHQIRSKSKDWKAKKLKYWEQ